MALIGPRVWVMRRAPPPSVQQWGGWEGGEWASGDAKLNRQSIISQALSCRMAPGLETGKAMMDGGGARRFWVGGMCLWALVEPRLNHRHG